MIKIDEIASKLAHSWSIVITPTVAVTEEYKPKPGVSCGPKVEP